MIHITHNLPSLEQINLPDGRRYKTPSGNLYPSVTTVLGSQENVFLKEWKEKVGEEEASRISRRAASKGSRVHLACEEYIEGKKIEFGMFEQEAKADFAAFIPVLESIEEVHAMEARLYSDKIQVAGTVDLICKLDGKMCILDWKTASRFKSREDIPDYFMQMSFYAAAFYERTGIVIKDLCVQMTAKDYGLITYWEKTGDWLPKFMKIRREFREKLGY